MMYKEFPEIYNPRNKYNEKIIGSIRLLNHSVLVIESHDAYGGAVLFEDAASTCYVENLEISLSYIKERADYFKSWFVPAGSYNILCEFSEFIPHDTA